MNEEELLRLIEKGESGKVEFKSDIGDGLGKSICSFANTNDGIILLGVGNDGKITGIDKKHERDIANIAHTCKPSVYPKIESMDAEGRNIFIITIKKLLKPRLFSSRRLRNRLILKKAV